MSCCFGGGGAAYKEPQPPERPPQAAAQAAQVSNQQAAASPPPASASNGGSTNRKPPQGRGSGNFAPSETSVNKSKLSVDQGGMALPSRLSATASPTPPRSDAPVGESLDNNTVETVKGVLRLNLAELKVALQKLAGVSSTASIGLHQSAEILAKHLAVSLCSITGFTDHCTTAVLLAAYGRGANELQSMPVMYGHENSHALALEEPECYIVTVSSEAEADEKLPPDLRPLYDVGLCSFMSVLISIEHEVAGTLLIAKEAADGFEVDWWEPTLGCVSTGLLSHLQNEQTTQLCRLIKDLDAAPDYMTVIYHMLHGVFMLLLRAKNVTSGCRMALINDDMTKAIVFEPDRSSMKQLVEAAASSGSVPKLTPGSVPQILVTELPMENTLLLDAVQKGKARFVSDCTSYIQSCMKPATDIFLSGNEMVASIVVLPLIYNGVAFGGLYMTLETTSYFQNMRVLLMGLVNSTVMVLHKQLAAQSEHIWQDVLAKAPIDSSSVSLRTAPTRTFMRGSSNTGGVPDSPANAGMGATEGSMDNSLSSIMSARPVVTKRNCTEAMLKVLQHEIRRTTAQSQADQWVEELVLTEVLGKGGFGMVYMGTWKGSVAAVKVMYARQHERQAMKDALEMALLTTVSHPFIIQVYSCLTDMVEDARNANSTNGGAPVAGQQPSGEPGRLNLRFRRLRPDEDPAIATCNILVMEYCDRQTLRHAMKRGVFHTRLDNNSIAAKVTGIVQVLIEVAQAIQHLHNLKLIHCDIKPENVLLKSDHSKPLGFQTKLSDFGLAKILRESYYIINRSGSGTVTHLAPELFQVGSKITTAVDAFSFGIMMWEVYTGQRVYSGLGRDAIIDCVYKRKGRPVFPLGAPQAYMALATACWDNNPRMRPSFVDILAKLTDMLTAVESLKQPQDATVGTAATAYQPALKPLT
mmetsp:Transcript_16992/g.50930  ORF Transcript_16992/g.50930 Transcript_16992/m.50930 type:complete len:923 (-) Transcript_16992:424-3192(-)